MLQELCCLPRAHFLPSFSRIITSIHPPTQFAKLLRKKKTQTGWRHALMNAIKINISWSGYSNMPKSPRNLHHKDFPANHCNRSHAHHLIPQTHHLIPQTTFLVCIQQQVGTFLLWAASSLPCLSIAISAVQFPWRSRKVSLLSAPKALLQVDCFYFNVCT